MYVETYRVGDSPLADHRALAADDRGLHVMIGEVAYISKGVGAKIGPELVAWQLQAYPNARIVAAEPSAANKQAIRVATHCPGAEDLGDIRLPHKLARLVITHRQAFLEGWRAARLKYA